MVDIQGNYVMAFLVLAVSRRVSLMLSVIIEMMKRIKRKDDDCVSNVTITTRL